MSLLVIFVLAISLSMDAFSLSLIYGTLNLDKKLEKLMSIMVGIFHFFMPILGYKLGKIILDFIKVDANFLVSIIFIILGMEMLLSIKKDERIKLLTGVFSVALFALTVSIDSFSVGISFGVVSTNILLACTIFSLTSALFTYTGVKFGKRLSERFGSITTFIGAIVLIILGVKYLI